MSNKPPHPNFRLDKDERAEVGIGTMIVFIATILVSAVAAGVLINTAQKLQAKSQQTGNEAVSGVASSLQVLDVTGERPGGTGNIDVVHVKVQLAAGADPVDIKKLIIVYNDGSAVTNFDDASVTPATYADFAVQVLRGTVTNNVMLPGDLVVLSFSPTTDMATSTPVTIQMNPAHGNPVTVGFTSPDGYSDKTWVDLF